MAQEAWSVGAAYESYVGRWSRLVGETFLHWLDLPAGQRWLDVGCGTGTLTEAVIAHAHPSHVVGVDTSSGFLARARARITDPRSGFCLGDARLLPFPDHGFDTVISGLAINFVPDPGSCGCRLLRPCR
jgi:ubiquinone/menaquinone biosynthesis C-methylase UbiE